MGEIFLMPNGDMYMLEPYSGQQNLTRNNWSFRDYYKGAILNNDTYLDDKISFVATNRSSVVVAVPVYSEPGIRNTTTIDTSSYNTNLTDDNLVGVWAGALDLDIHRRLVQSLVDLPSVDPGERIVILDSKGLEIADSFDKRSSSQSRGSNTNLLLEFSNLTSFKSALNGKQGSLLEVVNGTQFLTSYIPIEAFHNTMVVLWMIPISR